MRGLIAKQQAILISEIKERQMIGRQGSFDRKTVERYVSKAMEGFAIKTKGRFGSKAKGRSGSKTRQIGHQDRTITYQHQ